MVCSSCRKFNNTICNRLKLTYGSLPRCRHWQEITHPWLPFIAIQILTNHDTLLGRVYDDHKARRKPIICINCINVFSLSIKGPGKLCLLASMRIYKPCHWPATAFNDNHIYSYKENCTSINISKIKV